MTARLIGGEMLVWSDLDGQHGPAPAGDAALRPLLAAVQGRVLVAGPHDPELIDAVGTGELTLLVRGAPDAEALTARYPDATVLCGSLEKLEGTPAYDTVVALDGLGRLRSAEDDAADVSWAEDLALLLAALAPAGRLLLGARNHFGLDRILAAEPSATDADWGTADATDPERPASPSELRAALAAAGLPVAVAYAGYPGVLLGDALLADRSVRGYVSAAVRSSVTTAAERLADPRRLASGAVDAGIAAELAPAWYVVAQREGAEAVELPDGVVGGEPIRADGSGGWVRGGVGLPVGRTVADLVLSASLRRDLPRLRELLSAWQASDLAAVPADRVVAGPGGELGGPVPEEPEGENRGVSTATPAAALTRLAAMLIDEGHAYLWPAPASVAELTALLASMAGVTVSHVPDVAGHNLDPRALTMAVERLERELAEAKAKHRWYENMLVSREAELKRARRINSVLLATMPGKAAKASYGGLRAGKKAARGVIKKLRG